MIIKVETEKVGISSSLVSSLVQPMKKLVNDGFGDIAHNGQGFMQVGN